MRSTTIFGLVSAAFVAGCSLITSLDGLSGGIANGVDASLPSDTGVSSDTSTTADAGADADAAIPVCDPGTPFGTPTLVPGANGTGAQQWGRLSGDEQEIFFQGDISNVAAVIGESRVSTSDPFSNPTGASFNESTGEYDPMLSLDNKTLLFSSARTGSLGARDIFIVTRAGRGQPFGTPTPLSAIDSTDDEAQPYFTPGNQQVWFGRSGSIAMATATSTGFNTPTLVEELNTAGSQTFPVPSADGLYIYFASDRNDASTGLDVFLARRASSDDAFGTPVTVAEVSSPVEDDPTWLSPDGCRLYISSLRSGTMEIYVASRSP